MQTLKTIKEIKNENIIRTVLIWMPSVMISMVFIHLYKGKPFEVTVLIVISIIFAAYIRNPQLFHQKYKP